VCTLANTKFNAIIKDAQEFIKPICAHNRDPIEVTNTDDDNNDNQRACLVNNSGSEVEYICVNGTTKNLGPT
jgi:hypothetical protein